VRLVSGELSRLTTAESDLFSESELAGYRLACWQRRWAMSRSIFPESLTTPQRLQVEAEHRRALDPW
jgi:hypothetical protein